MKVARHGRKKRKAFFLAFDRSMNFDWLKKLQTTIDLQSQRR